MTKILIDSNVLIYSEDSSDLEKHQVSKELIKTLLLSREAAVSIQNLVEFVRGITEKIKKPKNYEEARATVNDYAKSFEILKYDQKTISEALHYANQYKIHFFDALIVATMEENSINEIITENTKDFGKIPWLKITNPFE